MERTQFTFYESFFKAISRIKKKSDRAEAYDAICAYALYGIEPDMDNMPDAAAIAYELSKPNLDASRRKADSGKKGGSVKQNDSKPEANGKQTASKKENKKEKEIENKCYNPLPPLFGNDLQSAFSDWIAYKKERKELYKPTGLRNLESEVKNNAVKYGEHAVAELIRKCMANNWKGIIFEKLEEQPKVSKAPAPAPYTRPENGRRDDMDIVRRMMEQERRKESDA